MSRSVILLIVLIVLIIAFLIFILLINFNKPLTKRSIFAGPVKLKIADDPDTLTTMPTPISDSLVFPDCRPILASVGRFQQDQNLPNQYFLISPKSSTESDLVIIRSNTTGLYMRIVPPCQNANLPYRAKFDEKLIRDDHYFKLTQNGENFQFESVAYPGKYLGKGDKVGGSLSPEGFQVISYYPLTLVSAPQNFSFTTF